MPVEFCWSSNMWVGKSRFKSDISLLVMLTRMVFSDMLVKEELLKNRTTKGRTKGWGNYQMLSNLATESSTPQQKLASVTAAGTPAGVSSRSWFIAISKKDDFPRSLSHTIASSIRKLWAQVFLILNISWMSRLRHSPPSGLQLCKPDFLIKALLEDFETDCRDLTQHSEVRWLSEVVSICRVFRPDGRDKKSFWIPEMNIMSNP